MSDTKHTPMVVAAARKQCALDAGDLRLGAAALWEKHSAEYLRDAEKVVAATGAPALLEALRELHEAESAPFPPAEAGQAAQTAWAQRKFHAHERARAAIAAATAPEQAK